MSEIVKIAQFVIEAILYAWPFFLISIILSVVIRSFQLDGLIRRFFNRRTSVAIVLAVFIGAFSPFCACTIVPIIAGLLASGVPLAPIMAFWIASPTMDPEIFALSVGIIGWPMAVTRLIATLILSLSAGFLTLFLTRSGWIRVKLPNLKGKVQKNTSLPQPERGLVLPFTANPSTGAAAGAACGTGACSLPIAQTEPKWITNLVTFVGQVSWPALGRDVLLESWRLGRWLLLAFTLEAFIVLYIPQEMVISLLGEDNWLAIPLAALVGVPLYLTNISALPIISGLLDQGMLPGAAIAFLIAGPVTTMPAMMAVWGTVQPRIFFLYLLIGLIGAVILGIGSNLFLI